MTTWRWPSRLLRVQRSSGERNRRPDLPARRWLALRSGTAIFLLLVAIGLVVTHAESQISVGPYNYTHITTPGPTLVVARQGVLHLVTINTTQPGTIILRDSATCPGTTTIGTIWGTVALTGQTLFYDVSFDRGLCVLTSGAPDVTVAWR